MEQPQDQLRPRLFVGSASVPPEELASIAEIAEMLGVTKRTAYRYIERADFPEPLGRVSAGPIWLRADVQAWGKKHLPLPPGRPRKSSS